MKKFISLFLACSLALSVVVIPASAEGETPSSPSIDYHSISSIEANFPSSFNHSTSYTDSLGNNGFIQFTISTKNTFVEVYVNGTLTQRAIASPEENIVAWIEYPTTSSATASYSVNPTLQSCKFSDLVSDLTLQEETSTDNDIAPFAFSPEGWSYLLTVPSNPTITGSKPCTVYSRNYDEEPDLNRYNAKQVKIGAGAAVGAVVSVVAAFITGGVTVAAIVTALGSAIVADAITSAITGTVCFSTQKIRYAPVINGTNIFPDAYITKRWVIIYDAVNKKESFKLDNEYYAYNRGESPHRIAYNAQMAEASS